MAYTVMADVIMACVVITYIALAYRLMTYTAYAVMVGLMPVRAHPRLHTHHLAPRLICCHN